MPRRKPRRRSVASGSSWLGIGKLFSGLNWEDVNLPLAGLTVLMLLFGVMMIGSASVVWAEDNGYWSLYFPVYQIIWILIGLVGCLIIYKLPLKTIANLGVLGMVVSIVLLVLVLIVGEEVNGAKRWIDFVVFRLQPSEVAKLGFTTYLAAWLAKPRPQLKKLDFREYIKQHFWYELLPFALLLFIVSGLIIFQPDLDTTVIIAFTALVVYFVSGQDAVHLFGTATIVVVAALAALLAALMAPYRLERVQTYVEFLQQGEFTRQQRQTSAFQVHNGLVAIAEGGLFGKGYTQSVGKLFYLSDAVYTDSIFAVIAEEFGLVGSVILIFAYLAFMGIGVNIAMNAPNKFAALLAVGVTTWITFQAFLNIGASLAVVPFGGIPLPFISYGGSGTLVNMAGVALLLNVHKNSK